MCDDEGVRWPPLRWPGVAIEPLANEGVIISRREMGTCLSPKQKDLGS